VIAVEVTCWRVYGWSRGRWTLRSTHATQDDAAEHAEALCHRTKIPTKVRMATTKQMMPTPAPPPGEAQRFREQRFDSMHLRRQAFTYFKSGANGTELMAPHDE